MTLVKIQLGDAATGSEGNNMLNEEIEVAAGESKSYTVTVGAGGLTTPSFASPIATIRRTIQQRQRGASKKWDKQLKG